MRLLAIALCLGFVACAPKNPTEIAPNSPQTTVALAVKTLADADQAAVKTVIALRDSGKITQANTVTLEDWFAFVATTDKSLGLILAKPEPWSQQKVEMLSVLATVTAPAIVTKVDPGAQTVVAQIMTIINQIKTLVVP